jgi:hypothetical protein
MLAVLFTRIMWGIWDAKELTPGDTSSYYVSALEFARNLTCNIGWSPLYTSWFGAWHWLSPDPFFAVIAHRIGILAALTILIFEISRRLLPMFIAWFITAWWLALPIDFNARYEVHLFALIPICIFWLLITINQSLTMRGVCVGLLLLSTVLVRNELLIVFGAFTFLSIVYDIWQARTGRRSLPLVRYLAAYGIPLAVAVAIILTAYWRSTTKYPELTDLLKVKHTLNVSQIYTFGYGQRNPGANDDPWVGYQALMKRTFGNELPTMREAFLANPKAMMEHFLWNVSLIPSGLQVALFNCRAGDFDPDYIRTPQRPAVAWALSAIYLALVAVAAVLVIRHREYWFKGFLEGRGWIFLGILTVCSTVCVVMVMQRPRPSYMFAQTVAMMLLAGFSVHVILHHLRIEPFVRRFAFLPMIAVAFLVPQLYVAMPVVPMLKTKEERVAARKTRIAASRGRPLLVQFRLLEPFRDDLAKKSLRAATGGYPFELNSYLGFGTERPEERFFDTTSLVASAENAAAFNAELRKLNVRVLTIPSLQTRKPAIVDFMKNAPSLGWKLERQTTDQGREYWLYISTDQPARP